MGDRSEQGPDPDPKSAIRAPGASLFIGVHLWFHFRRHGRPAEESMVQANDVIERTAAHWSCFGHPIRPSPDDVACFAAKLPSGSGLRSLVLGATPELVDMLVRLPACRVVSVDQSPAALPAMRKFAAADWSGVEAIVSDWRQPLPALEGSFDVAVGHGPFCFLPFPGDWRLLLDNLRRYLVPGGVIVSGEMFLPAEPFDFGRRCAAAVAEFEAARHADAEARRAAFRILASELRMAAVLGAADTAGRVAPERRAALRREAFEELRRRYEGEEIWPIAEALLATEREIGGAPLAASTVQRWEDAREVISSCGFEVVSAASVGRRPAPGVWRIFAARRT
jgi:SAM-dependent methyltransferase